MIRTDTRALTRTAVSVRGAFVAATAMAAKVSNMLLA
jgi:hypothetical protein